jgi:hypothetical protein
VSSAKTETKKFTDVILETPILRGETKIEKITIRKPAPGEMRGLRLSELMNSDVSALITIIPRVSDPALIEQEIEVMEVDDFTALGNAVVDFLWPASMKAALGIK